MTGFMINFSGSNHKLYDRDGSIFTSYILAGETVEQNIGTVDYNIGEIEFSANFIQTEPILKLTIVPDEDNYYVTQNKVVQISSIKPELLNVVRR